MSYKIYCLPKSLEILFNIKESYYYVIKALEIVNNYSAYNEYKIRLNYLESKLKSLVNDLESEYKLIINNQDESKDKD